MGNTNDSRPQGMPESESHENDRQLRLLVENTGDMISRHLPDSTITCVSPPCRTLMGYTPDELVNTRATDYVYPDDMEVTLSAIDRAVESRDEHYRVQHRMKRKDGELIWVETIGRLLAGTNCGLREIQCIVRDITDRKRAEEEREELIAKREAQNTELERFTYTVSHDLRSPLITIEGYLGLLREDLGNGVLDTADDDLAHMSRAAQKMNQMLTELLELSRASRMVNASEDVSLEKVVSVLPGSREHSTQ